MTKTSKFKKLSTNIIDIVKNFYVIKNIHNNFLEKKEISLQDINLLKKNFEKEYVYHNGNEDIIVLGKDTYLLKLLQVKSFYSNANLFNALLEVCQEDKSYFFNVFEKMFTTTLHKKTYNELVDKVDINQLKKNIELLDNNSVNLMVLQKALLSDNVALYDFIESYLDWGKDYNKIVQNMCYVIQQYGNKIKDKQIAEKIKKHVNVSNFKIRNIDISQHKCEENLNSFFNIKIRKFVVEEKFSPLQLKNLNLTNQQTENILENLDTNRHSYSSLIYHYIKNETNNNKSIYEKFKFLKQHDLISNQIWELMINPYNTDLINIIFQNNEIIKEFISEEQYKGMIETYKEYFFARERSLEDTQSYLDNYPYSLSQPDIVFLVTNMYVQSGTNNVLNQQALDFLEKNYQNQIEIPQTYTTNAYTKDIIDLNQKIENQQKHFLTTLYEKYPEHMKNENVLLNIAKDSKNDWFLSSYLDKYFSNNNNLTLKKQIAENLDIFNLRFPYEKTLQWVIENNQLSTVANEKNTNSNLFIDYDVNYMVPLLIEEYGLSSDFVVKQSIKTTYNNQELFNFIVNNYKLSTVTEQYLCQQVYLHDKKEIAQEMFKKGIVPNAENIAQLNINRNESGDILLKSYLKSKLEQNFENSARQKTQSKVKKI